MGIKFYLIKFLKVWVDDIFYEVPDESTIFQFCQSINLFLPCFCYHEKLTIAGNCRACLVEANNALVVSCAMPLLDNMRIFTKSTRVVKARENVMEFLLLITL